MLAPVSGTYQEFNMSFTIHTAAARLSRQVPEAEAAIDDAMLKLTDVIATSIGARRDTGIRETVGQAALARLHKCLGAMISVQGDLLRAHGQMARIGVETGIMDEPNCPDRPGASAHDQVDMLKAV
jgi:hypothetical protein